MLSTVYAQDPHASFLFPGALSINQWIACLWTSLLIGTDHRLQFSKIIENGGGKGS